MLVALAIARPAPGGREQVSARKRAVVSIGTGRTAGRAGLVAQQSIHARLRIARLPPPDRRPYIAWRATSATARHSARQKDDTCTLLLGMVPISGDRYKPCMITITDDNADCLSTRVTWHVRLCDNALLV
jgi:hypothetical protein